MATKYIFRMDDITSDMDWEYFWKYINLFKEYKVKPLLGIVPDNKDAALAKNKENPDFWNIIRELESDDIVEFAQHGYQHKYVTKSTGIFGERWGILRQSEFAGLPYRIQLEKITKGKEILVINGIKTQTWMAPSHTFDKKTLRALCQVGFKYVTDGWTLYPFKKEGLVFVPRQYPYPKEVRHGGVVTIGIHANERNEKLFMAIENFLKKGYEITSFSEAARAYKFSFWEMMANLIFRETLALRYRFRRFKRNVLRPNHNIEA